MPEPARLEARGRPWLDDAAVVGTDIVPRAGVTTGDADVERRAALAVVPEETPPRRAIVDDGEPAEKDLAVRASEHTCLVGFKQMHRARTVVATATAGHAVGAG